ncbi:MAG: hypothetical protein ACFFCS_13255 [Candidatus Hodarchaeota archaeon]
MAWIGAVAATAAIENQMIYVLCKTCNKRISVLKSGVGPNTCVACGMDFCNDCGISYMCDQCFSKVPGSTKEHMLSERDKIYKINGIFWVFIIAVVIQATIGMIPILLGLNNLEFVLVFGLLGPIFTAIIPVVIIKLKEEQVRNHTIDIARSMNSGL